MAGPDSRVIIGPPLSDEPETKSGEPRDASGDEWLGPDFVEHVVAPRPLSQDDFEFLRREHRLLVLENIFDGNSRARGVDPRVHPISLGSSGATRSMRNRFACLPCFSAR